jgi:hypothetical protein
VVHACDPRYSNAEAVGRWIEVYASPEKNIETLSEK